MTLQTGTNSQVIVSGACGTIGVPLTELLCKSGHAKIIAWCMDEFKLAHLKTKYSNQLKIIKGSFDSVYKEIQSESKAKPHPLSFIHLAGIANAKICSEDPVLAKKINAELTHEIAGFARDLGVLKFVYSSTGLVYGTNLKRPAQEIDKPEPFDVYTETKLKGEEAVSSVFTPLTNQSAFVFRFSNLYSERSSLETMFGKLKSDIESKKEVSLRSFSPTRDFLYLGDAVTAFQKAILHPLTGMRWFNVSTGIGTTVGELALHACRVMGLPESTLKETSHEKVESYNVLNPHQIKSNLGWKPETDLETGLKRSLQGKAA